MNKGWWGRHAFCISLSSLVWVLAAFPSKANATTLCTPNFPFQKESNGTWLGGDGGFLAYAGPDLTFWAFGDTFVGKVGAKNRIGAQVVGNTIGVGVCKNGNWSVNYYWRGTNGHAGAFFNDGLNLGQNYRLWPSKQWLINGQLFVMLTQVIDAPGGLGFRTMGTKIARIRNPAAPPLNWNIEYLTVSDQFNPIVVGEVWSDNQEWLFLYTPIGVTQTAVMRLPLTALLNDQDSVQAWLQYLSKNGQWIYGFNPADMIDLGFGSSAGMSVRWNGAINKWQAVFVDTKVFPTPFISMAIADAPFGPFTDERPIYTMPFTQPGNPNYDVNNICYSAKEDYFFENNVSTDLFLTYSCTSTDLAKVTKNLRIYFPDPVRLKNPFVH